METGNTILKKMRVRVHLPPAKMVRAALLFASLVLLEAAPVGAWLCVYAAAQLGDVRLTAAPFGLVLGVLSLFAVVRWRFARFGPIVVSAALVFSALASILALARFSPLMYESQSLSPLALSWLSDLFSLKSDYSGLVGLVALVVYLGWRGISLGAPAPALSRVSRRFSIGLGVLTLAIFGSLASAPGSKSEVSATLLALLALEGFGGLTALALSRPLAGSGRTDAVMPGAEYSTRWQVTAVAIAFVIVAFVALIGGALNLSAAQSLFTWLAPVASVINRFASWLAQSLAYLLYLIFVRWLSLLFPKNLPSAPIKIPHPVTKGPLHQTQLDPGAFSGVAALILGAIGIIAILILLFFFARALLKSLNKPTAEEVEEERERLDASSLLKQQALDALNRLRGLGRRAPARDDVRRGGVRWLYREVMRAGARAGYARKANETADEYAARLAVALDSSGRLAGASVAGDLASLAHTYDDARYGAVDDDPPASDEVAAKTRLTTQRISALGQESTQRRH